MNLTNYYWYFQKAVPSRICDLIVKQGLANKEAEHLALTGGFGRDRDLSKAPLTKKEIADLKKKEIQIYVGLMIIGFIEKYTLLYMKQIKVLVGILNGIIQNLVNLLFTKKINIMIGIVIVGINLIMKMVQQKAR